MLNTNCLHTATAIIAEDKVTDFFRIANDLCKVFCIYCNRIKIFASICNKHRRLAFTKYKTSLKRIKWLCL